MPGTTPGGHVWLNSVRYASSHDDYLALRQVWWADFLGRRHLLLLVLSGREALELHIPPENAPTVAPLFEIYPQAGLHSASGEAIVLCACGAVGTPAEIAWMGTECGPCHDRRQAEELPPRPWDAATREIHPAGPIHHVYFVGRGIPARLLINEIREVYTLGEWSIARGEPRPLQHGGPFLLATNPEGTQHLTTDLRVLSGELDSRDILPAERHLNRASSLWDDRDNKHPTLSPSGRYLMLSRTDGGLTTLHIWDWADETRPPFVYGGPTVACVFAPDESVLYLVDATGRIQLSSPPLVGPWRSFRTGLPNLSNGELYPVPREHLLFHRREGDFTLLDTRDGALLDRFHLPEFEKRSLPAIQSTDGRVLLSFQPGEHRLQFHALPEFADRGTLAFPDSLSIHFLAQSDLWLVVGESQRLRLLPRGPLLEWARHRNEKRPDRTAGPGTASEPISCP